MKLLVAAVLVMCMYEVAGRGNHRDRKRKESDHFPYATSGTIEMKSPDLNNEEAHSNHMPDHLKCDACRAIAYQIQEYLSKKESKISAVKEGKAQLSESDYIETLDLCCSQSWEIYGVMEVNGVKRLSGPGLETEEHPGVMMTSGPWPARLYKMCQAYLGELTEEEIYQEFRNNRDYLEDFLCYDKNGTCTKLGNTIWIPQKEEF
uniref:Uncharacterized protein n=2 Tax=Callorhinchus milii TaxID=7868 RepID=A0A4W3HIM0_CALMI|eukprot:gi/632957134/ref/XP_007894308.1/ PREDICTED: marginal zone B- and B1-cell-specific protein [Callorhinchus milii]